MDTLLSIEIALLIQVFFLCKYKFESPKRNLNVLWDMFYHVKEPKNNLLIEHTFLSNAHTLWSLFFIYTSKANAQYQGILTFFIECANGCIWSTCCTIICKHQYKAPMQQESHLLLLRWSIMLFFPSFPIWNTKKWKEREWRYVTNGVGLPFFFHQ